MERITDGLCCGCKACEQVCAKRAIEMKLDHEGFWYPIIDQEKCIDCGRCSMVCPINLYSFSSGIPKCLCYYHLNQEEKMQYSSGGAFISICKNFLVGETHYAVYGAALTNENVVKHVRIDDLTKIVYLSRSKYVQSDTAAIYENVKSDLDTGIKVVFSGTPCQIQALKNYLYKDYENLLLVDFVCHGVPSPLAYKKYCDSIEKKYSKKISNVLFRYKVQNEFNQNWDTQGICIVFKDGTSYCATTSQDIYMRSFHSDLLSRPSCGECKFSRIHRTSDLTMGDFWGIEEQYLEYAIKKTGGTSMILINTSKGKNVVDAIERNLDDEVFEYVDITIGTKYNIPLTKSSPFHPLRNTFYKNLIKKRWSFEECYNRTLYPSGNIIKKIIRKIKQK